MTELIQFVSYLAAGSTVLSAFATTLFLRHRSSATEEDHEVEIPSEIQLYAAMERLVESLSRHSDVLNYSARTSVEENERFLDLLSQAFDKWNLSEKTIVEATKEVRRLKTVLESRESSLSSFHDFQGRPRSSAVHLNLRKIKGVGLAYSDLLAAAGVESIQEMARCDASTLWKRLTRTNMEQLIVKRVPSEATIERWIKNAKSI